MTKPSVITEDISVTSARALREVFSKQLKLQIHEFLEIDPLSTFEGKLLHSAVSINGEKISGTVLLQLPEKLALQITEIMLGSAGDAEENRDVTGELCNMIAGCSYLFAGLHHACAAHELALVQ